MLFKLEIGRKFAILLDSRPGFLRRGVMRARLKVDGKRPSLNDRLASLAIRSEKT
jgi:hypothetical protein